MDVFGKDLNSENEVEGGNLLLAEPMLADSNFQRTVILVCEHIKEEGSFGLVINKLADVAIQELEDLLPTENNLYVGGPVQQNTLHFIHKFKDLEGAAHLGNGVYWGGDFEEIKHKGLIGELSSENIRFFLGYSGWGENQLHEEV
ncbi:MAG: putative transcriptional regulator, partial [Bacteroidia bacterium]